VEIDRLIRFASIMPLAFAKMDVQTEG
jgi:hypothetical protein